MTTPYRYEGMQSSHQTRVNRFPKIFSRAKTLCPNPKRILSFGCSTGEECQSIAEIFPNSEIVGIDIDHWAVQKARNNNKSPRVFFHDDLGATGNYDIVFCLMVLFALEKPISFKMFEKSLKKMDRHLNPGGYLMLYTTDYNPLCTETIRNGYDVLSQWIRIHNRNQQEYYNGYYKKNEYIQSSGTIDSGAGI